MTESWFTVWYWYLKHHIVVRSLEIIGMTSNGDQDFAFCDISWITMDEFVFSYLFIIWHWAPCRLFQVSSLVFYVVHLKGLWPRVFSLILSTEHYDISMIVSISWVRQYFPVKYNILAKAAISITMNYQTYSNWLHIMFNIYDNVQYLWQCSIFMKRSYLIFVRFFFFNQCVLFHGKGVQYF